MSVALRFEKYYYQCHFITITCSIHRAEVHPLWSVGGASNRLINLGQAKKSCLRCEVSIFHSGIQNQRFAEMRRGMF